jgi:hypothetical protein
MFTTIFRARGLLNRERRSKFLLASIVLFFVLPSFSENYEVGKIALVLNLYVTLVGATMELEEKRKIFWIAVPVAVSSMVLLGISHYAPTTSFLIANGLALTVFFALVCISLFIYLGEPGQITIGRIYVSASLYLLLGMSWFAIYNLLDVLQPGSLLYGGSPLPPDAPWSTILYFSLVTLTTTGYGDIVPSTPAARMCAALEAATGVLYVAIAVSRLVAMQLQSVQQKDQD